MKRLIKKKYPPNLDKIRLTNPQREAVVHLLAVQKNKYKKLLHQTHEKLHVIADNTSNLELWYNMNGEYEFVSPNAETIIGHPPDSFYKHLIVMESLIHPDFVEKFLEDKARALNGEEGRDVLYKIVRSDGVERWVSVTWKPVVTRLEKHIGVRISVNDMTELLHYRELAGATEKIIESIAEELPDTALFTITPEGVITSWSSSAGKLTGYSSEEVLQSNVAHLIPRTAKISELLPNFAVQQNGDKYVRRSLFKKKNGEVFQGEILYKCIRGTDNSLLQIPCILRAVDLQN